MNYLAHALLSPGDPLILMGNLWGDLIKPRDYASLNPVIVQGVHMHKAIDAFTDQHSAVEQMVRILRPYQGKYTPVVTDVLMDFMLSKTWSDYQVQPLEAFCMEKYKVIRDYLEMIPDRMHSRIHRMLSDRWLESCKSRERMHQTLRMLSMRASFENKIPEAMIPYDAHQEQMDRLFAEFFADVQQYISLQSAG